MSKPNQQLRDYAKGNGVSLWQIADFLKMSEQTLIRKLRVEFDEEQQAIFKNAVREIKKERNY